MDATGVLYGREARRGKTTSNAKARREKARTARSRGLFVACDGHDALMPDERDLLVEAAVHAIQGNFAKATCETCGIVKEGNQFHLKDPDQCC